MTHKLLTIVFLVCACLTLNTQALPGITDCVAGSGTDYQVGPNNGQLASLDLVPWENLEAGDTVRIFYKSEPYRGKMLLTGNGTPEKWIRVCGVKGSNGERPIVDGENAVAREGTFRIYKIFFYSPSSGNVRPDQNLGQDFVLDSPNLIF
jgi:hypothetical protein